MYDVSVKGARVFGAMIARTKYNLKICILEKVNDVAMDTYHPFMVNIK